MSDIDYAAIEKKWQDKWDKKKVFVAKDNSKKPKYYVLEMFPYPSGSGLHMGHAWNYTIGDILARYKLMSGFNVLHPMGYDALGLPAENAAIKEDIHPQDYTMQSMKHFGHQQRSLGLTYDWDRLVATDDPDYYTWDQWIFLKMYEKGLAYQKESSVNWCPKCNTVLANEQVHDGRCWRHDDTEVEIKKLKQWFLKITDYADELYEKIDELTEWPEKTKAMQKNWIGKSYGTEIDFEINGQEWPVFTTRPDTIFGVTFMVVSAQHSKLDELVTEEHREEVHKFLKKVKSISEKDLAELDKIGAFTGSYALNPANGKKVPVYAGNFVVADYGSGMVMAVPAHDQRDYEFAKKYDIEIRPVINGEAKEGRAYTDEGALINSGEFDGVWSKDAIEKISEWLIDKNVARRKVNFKLRDWGISRQRYWGTPIPIIYCDACGVVAVPESDLPVELPREVEFGKGNPLLTNEEWLNVTCPKCGGNGRREADTMDTFVNSSWYFLRYCDSQNEKEIFDTKKVKYWCPIDSYIGGAEHACMHLIYFRFYTKFLRDLGLVEFDEPAVRLFHQGMLHGEGGEKMSKSKGNVVLPETVSDKYGIDTARFFLSSLASPDKNIDWSEKGISGSSKFIKKIFNYVDDWVAGKDTEEIKEKLNKTILNVGKYYDNFDYRKATIEIRELFNLIENEKVSKNTLEKFLKILNPICPHITEELWEKLGNKDLISVSSWPKADKKKIVEEKESDINERAVEEIKKVLEKTGTAAHKIYVYVMPFEVENINLSFISSNFDASVEIFSVKDKDKYDPENKAKKAKPGKPAVYVE